MKTKFFLLLIPLILLTGGCGFKKAIESISSKATELLEDISDLTRTLDAKVENDQITENLANTIEEKLNNLAGVLTQLVEQNGGFLFEQVNGTIDNIFDNTSSLISGLTNELLGESTIPDIIDQLAAQLELQTNLLMGHIEDVIILATGSVTLVIDKTTNSAIILVSIILLAIGLIIFVIILFRKKSVVRTVGIIFMLIFVLFFLSILLIAPVRANLIKGLDLGEEIEQLAMTPKVRGVLPASFVVGGDERIIIYGTNLDRIDTLGVSLMLNQAEAYKFKDENLVVATPSKIVLGNFDDVQRWSLIKYAAFKTRLDETAGSVVPLNNLKEYSRILRDRIYPQIRALHPVLSPAQPAQPVPVIQPVMAPQPVAALSGATIINASELAAIKSRTAVERFGSLNAGRIERAINTVFRDQYEIPEGDFGLVVFDGEKEVSARQLISILYPPPPVPDPDLRPVNLYWTGNRIPVRGEMANLSLVIRIDYPEQVTDRFRYRITSTPPTSTLESNVEMGEIAAATSNNYTTITTRNFSVVNPGSFNFQARLDDNNRITESNEGNNDLNRTLAVKDFVYDMRVEFLTFQSTKRMDDNERDEYRISFGVSVTGQVTWTLRWDKDGTPMTVYNMNMSRNYSSVSTPAAVQITTSGYEQDNNGCSDWSRFWGTCNENDNMGSASYKVSIPQNATGTADQKDYTFTLNAANYKVTGRVSVVKRIL